MIRLADFCYRRRRLVLLGWVVGLVVVFALGQALPAKHRAEYRTPGAEATKAYDLLGERFPREGRLDQDRLRRQPSSSGHQAPPCRR